MPPSASLRTLSRSIVPLARQLPAQPSLSAFVARRPLHSSTRRGYPTTQSTPAPSTTCPSCSAPLPPTVTPVCPACSALLPPPLPSTTSFELFGVPQAYELDLKDLKRNFLKFQQKVHPDLFSGQGEKESWAKSWSGKVNDAFKLLENGRSRGEYLLSLSDVVIGEGEGMTDPELLMEIMEVREALEEATTEEEVSTIRQTNKDAMQETFASLSTAFANQPPDLESAKTLLIKLKYLQNVEDVCREWSPGRPIELQH